LEGYGSVWV